MAMDQQKLRKLVFEKTGVQIDIDDPIFALVALNDVVLEETTLRHVALLGAATQELAQALHAGTSAAPDLTPAFSAPREARLIALGASIAILAALLVLAGQVLFFKPPAESMIEVPRLTPSQATALKNGEKLNLVVQRLDQKTRELIQSEMEKP